MEEDKNNRFKHSSCYNNTENTFDNKLLHNNKGKHIPLNKTFDSLTTGKYKNVLNISPTD